MKNLGTVYQFELKGLLKKKAYLVTTIILSLIILIATSIPTLSKVFSSEPPESGAPGMPTGSIGVLMETDAMDKALFEEKLQGLQVSYFNDRKSLEDAVTEESVMAGYVIHSSTAYTALLNNVVMFTGGDFIMDMALSTYGEDLLLLENGHDKDAIRAIIGTVTITKETEVLGKDVQSSYWVVYALIMLTFMIIMFYGNNVATYVAREKSDRTMEILVTSSDTNSLIIGKVLASGTAGILQVAAMGLSLFLGLRLNRGNYGEEFLQFLKVSIAPDLLLVFALFALTGYFLFLFIYAGIGALMSKVEDVPAATTLITMLVMVAYFISMFSLNLSESMLLKVTSYLPFTSFMVMFVRYAISSVTTAELAISYGLLLLAAVLVALASVRIYRFGTLNYGNRGGVMKLIRKALKEER